MLSDRCMVDHYCPAEGTTLAVENGQECNWCGKLANAEEAESSKPWTEESS